jgi:hypothetical protein
MQNGVKNTNIQRLFCQSSHAIIIPDVLENIDNLSDSQLYQHKPFLKLVVFFLSHFLI